MTTEPWRSGHGDGRSVAILGAAGLAVVAALRLLTLAADTWEWDELLFVAAARDGFDVRLDRPHPPGYPLLVLPARLLVLLGAPPFGAVLAVAALAGIASVVVVALLARELGAGRREALWGAGLWAVVPAVWLHSVRPLSDSLGAAAFFLAALLLLRCARAERAGSLVAAAVGTAACAGVRPQVAAALLPLALVAAWRASRRPGGARALGMSTAAGIGTVAVAYLPIVWGSGGLPGYLASVRRIAAWVRLHDTPALTDLATAEHWARWLVDPFGGPLPAGLVWAAAGAGLAAAPRPASRLAIVFLPLLVLSVATLNVVTAPRYALPLLAAGPIAAALGLSRVPLRLHRLASVGATVLTGLVAIPAVPALVEAARGPSPPVAAMRALGDDPALRSRPLLLDPGLYVHRRDLAPAVPGREIEPGRPLGAGAGVIAVTHDRELPGARRLRLFRFESDVLRRISRGRYLSAAIWEPEGAAAPSGPFKATDPQLLSAVDDPADGAVVRAPVRVRGWCRERGGGFVAPVEFRVDGVPVAPEKLVRTARPDVAAAIPAIGDGAQAGFEATLPDVGFSPGEHVLEVVFETGDRRRVYPPRRFTLVTDPR